MEFILNLRAQIIDIFNPYLPTIEFSAMLISLALFTGIVILIFKVNYIGMKTKYYREALRGEGVSRHRTVKIWKRILGNLQSGNPARRKFAIIEADKVLDEILKLSGYKGEDMGERLKQVTPAQISNIEDIWTVHRIRNRIAHESDYELSEESAERAISIYARTFRQLGLID